MSYSSAPPIKVRQQMVRHDLFSLDSGGQCRITEIRSKGKLLMVQTVMPDIDVEEMPLGN